MTHMGYTRPRQYRTKMTAEDERATDPLRTSITSVGDIQSPVEREVASLVVLRGVELRPPVPVGIDGLIIGRSTDADLCIEHDSISRQHCRVEATPEGYRIRDLQSTNGTFVNDRKVDVAYLQDGDQIRTGRVILKFVVGTVEGAYHHELYRLVTLDPLTQTFNRRHFEQELDREHSRASRYGRTFSVIVFDFDHFKQINDTYGHLAGDAVLKQLSDAFRSRIRRDDVFARIGGEEFAVLCPESDVEGASHLASDLNVLARKAAIEWDGATITATISLGVAEWNGPDETAQALLDRADARLYDAKRLGRDRYCV
jgi:two-component system, cell cycle response regulator